MQIKSPLLALICILFFSCDPSEEVLTETPITEKPVAEDEKKPEMTVNGFTDIIETTTTISISVVDDSEVETKVMYDGEELATSSEKQFELTINPYIIPVGLTDFIVFSRDAKGNEISETYSVEIKHLLIDNIWFNIQESEILVQRWLFINSIDGKELAVFEETAKNQKIYTDEIIQEDTVLFSTANYITWRSSSDGSDTSLSLTTYKIPLGGKKLEGVSNTYPELNNTTEVTLKGIPFVNYSPDYYAYGGGYNTTAYTGDDEQTTLTIEHDASQPIFIRTNRWGGSEPKFDGKKENYKYVIINPEMGNTSVEIEADQLIPAENSLRLDIPEQDPGTLFFHRDAFKNAEDIAIFKGSSIYDKDSGNETVAVDYLDLPVFPAFNHYINNISYSINGSYYSARGTDAELDVNMPNWSASAQLTDANIEVVANNPEIDYYYVGLNKREYDNNNGRAISWRYNVFEENGTAKVVTRLELPKLIKETIDEPYYEITSDMEINGLTAIDYAKIDSYDEIVEWFVFNNNDFASSGNQYRQVSFPISNSSGKSDITNRPSNLNALQHYGLDERGQMRMQ